MPCENVQSAIDAVKSLDGRTTTQVVLEGDDKALLIGGGNDGRYNVVLAVNIDEAFFNLLNSHGSPDREVRIVTGGQAGLFPETQSVSLEAVLKAATYFFDSGGMNPNLAWEQQ
jgi:hypothetical protein